MTRAMVRSFLLAKPRMLEKKGNKAGEASGGLAIQTNGCGCWVYKKNSDTVRLSFHLQTLPKV